MQRIIRRGDIFYADLGSGRGSEQEGIRPVLVIQNNKGNKHSPTVIITAITSRRKTNNMPTHVKISDCGLPCNSIVLTEQIQTIDKTRLRECVGSLSDNDMKKVNRALCLSIDTKNKS